MSSSRARVSSCCRRSCNRSRIARSAPEGSGEPSVGITVPSGGAGFAVLAAVRCPLRLSRLGRALVLAVSRDRAGNDVGVALVGGTRRNGGKRRRAAATASAGGGAFGVGKVEHLLRPGPLRSVRPQRIRHGAHERRFGITRRRGVSRRQRAAVEHEVGRLQAPTGTHSRPSRSE